MVTPKLKLKNGDLSAYSFLCGYVQKYKKNGVEIEFYMEHSHYQVKIFEYKKVTPYIGCLGVETDETRNLVKWETFDKLSDARKFFQKNKKLN